VTPDFTEIFFLTAPGDFTHHSLTGSQKSAGVQTLYPCKSHLPIVV
jgi:hypothetical protein